MGKLRIYMKTGEVIKSKNLLRKMFPKTKYLKNYGGSKSIGYYECSCVSYPCCSSKWWKDGFSFNRGDTSGLTVCIELVDERNKLEAFFKTHEEILKENTVIYKEVEFWEYKE